MIRTWLVSYPIEIGIFKPIHLHKDQNTFQICTVSSHNDFSNYHGFIYTPYCRCGWVCKSFASHAGDRGLIPHRDRHKSFKQLVKAFLLNAQQRVWVSRVGHINSVTYLSTYRCGRLKNCRCVFVMMGE